jgi:hypothetical protein
MAWPSPQEYSEAIQAPHLCFDDPELKLGSPELNRLGLPRVISGNFASVYPVRCGNRAYAVRCFLRSVGDQQERYTAISEHLSAGRPDWLVGFEFLERGIRVLGNWCPALKMEWLEAQTLDHYIHNHLGKPASLRALADQWCELVRDLQRASIAHGDLQHGNVLVCGDKLRLIDYDGMWVPSLAGRRSDELGHRNYQHPLRHSGHFGPYLDNFSAWVIYTSLLLLQIEPGLWQGCGAGDEHLLFRKEDFDDPVSSRLFSTLEQIRDHRAKEQVARIRWLLSLDPTAVPQLDPIPMASARSIPKPCHELPDWLRDHDPESPRTKDADAISASDWIIDHLPPLEPVILPRLPFVDQGVSGVGAALLLGLVAASLSGVVEPVTAAWASSAVLMGVQAFWSLRYASLPEVRAKSKLNSQLCFLRKSVAESESLLRRHLAECDAVQQELHDAYQQLVTEQSQLRQREREELARAEAELLQALTRLNAERQSLQLQEKEARVREIRKAQEEFIRHGLAQHRVTSGAVYGIWDDLITRLKAAGIRSAADVVDLQVVPRRWGTRVSDVTYLKLADGRHVHVPGIGPKKAAALLEWRRNIRTALERAAPRTLSVQQDACIRQEYGPRFQDLDLRESGERENIRRKKSDISARYEDLQRTLNARISQLEAEAASARRERETRAQALLTTVRREQWQYNNAHRDLKAYRTVRFATYLKRLFH